MFVLLAIPILGGLLAGRLIESKRTAMIVTAALWLIGSALIVWEKAIDTKGDFNVNLWIGVAVGLLGFATASMGHRNRSRR